MIEILEKPPKTTLYTCEIDDGGPKMHPCHKAHDALDEAGIEYETVIADRNRPFGFGSKGTRPEIKGSAARRSFRSCSYPTARR